MPHLRVVFHESLPLLSFHTMLGVWAPDSCRHFVPRFISPTASSSTSLPASTIMTKVAFKTFTANEITLTPLLKLCLGGLLRSQNVDDGSLKTEGEEQWAKGRETFSGPNRTMLSYE